MSEKKINNLLPALIEKTDKSYVAVEELGQVLQETLSPTAKDIPAGRRIKNIAITGSSRNSGAYVKLNRREC